MTETRSLVARLLATPDLARVVPQLPPRVLNQLIERCGLEACADIVALATPKQLQRVLDVDLWRAPVAGADETLDGDRFGVWLEVLLQSGPAAAADRLAAMDLDLVVGGLADHVRVFDGGAVSAYTSLDGELMEHYVRRGNRICDIGGFVVEAREVSAWEVIVELLVALHAERPAFFHRIMRGCVALSHGAYEKDGCDTLLDNHDQQRADLGIHREARRDSEGYVAPAQARAFLQASRVLKLTGTQPPIDPIARACLRDLVNDAVAAANEVTGDAPVQPVETTDAPAALSEVIGILSEAGVIPPPRALLTSGSVEADRLAPIRAFIDAHLTAQEELAFLANALVAGCGVNGRPFALHESPDAVLATCSLGLENQPRGWVVTDLITLFQIGWAVLHRDLCRHAARTLIDVLRSLSCSDRDVQRALDILRRELAKRLRDGEPWRARPALDAILMLDPPAWAVIRALIDEFPTLHTSLIAGHGARTVDPASVAFVACNAEIATVRAYLDSLAVTLSA